MTHWLVSDAAQRWLEEVAAALASGPATPALIRSLRASVGPERTSLLLDQVELRTKARVKFSQADRLFFTRQGLEQATDEVLAGYKATRFTWLGPVADLCCGIGGDAMALGQEHPLMLVDRNEAALVFAEANVRRMGGQAVTALVESVKPDHVHDAEAWHIDPDRRARGSRTSRVELGEPGVDVLDQLRSTCPNAAVKLAPAAELPDDWLAECEREWIETRGECRQQVAWFGSLTEAAGCRTATLIDESGDACSFTNESVVPVSFAASIGRFLYDPSPALLAAGLVGELAEIVEALAISRHALYLTSDEEIVHPLLQSFVVEAELPLDVRKLKAYLQSHHVGRLEIKKRGVDITPETLRPQLDLSGDEEATLILARLDSGNRAFVCRRI